MSSWRPLQAKSDYVDEVLQETPFKWEGKQEYSVRAEARVAISRCSLLLMLHIPFSFLRDSGSYTDWQSADSLGIHTPGPGEIAQSAKSTLQSMRT